MTMLKRLYIGFLEGLCGALDAIPSYEEGRWYRHGDRGCIWGVSHLAVKLDEKWGTGVWVREEEP